MLRSLLITHPVFLEHETGEDHPESPERLAAILRVLDQEEFCYLGRDRAPAAKEEQLLRAHSADHVRRILALETTPGHCLQLDDDTVISARSVEAALHAAGGVCAAVDEVAAGRSDNVFCAVRPPGHHAERGRALGFCLFNNVAVGALHARDAHGFQRVAALDFDVHHGNGTQQIFSDEPGTFYASTHQAGLFPYSGTPEDRGAPGGGRLVNVPLPAGSGSDSFRAAYEEVIFPALAEFEPDFLFLSAGFDGHARDPLGQLRLHVSDFNWITQRAVQFAHLHCGNRLVSALEGGYDIDALTACVMGHVRVLQHG